MAFLVLAAVFWGSSFPVITYALRDISPALFVVLRFVLAFLILSVRYRSPSQLRQLFRRDLFLIAIPNALAFILQYKGQELTTASKAALFVNSTPIFVVAVAFVFYRERFHGRELAATALALVGVVITSTGLDFSDVSQINIGDVLCLIVGCCWAIFILFSTKAVKRYDPWSFSAGLYFWTILLLLPAVALEPLHFEWRSVVPIAYLAIMTTVVAYYFYLRGVQSVSSLATSVVILIEIVVAFLISYFFLDEMFTGTEAIGVALVLGGILLVLRRRKTPAKQSNV